MHTVSIPRKINIIIEPKWAVIGHFTENVHNLHIMMHLLCLVIRMDNSMLQNIKKKQMFSLFLLWLLIFNQKIFYNFPPCWFLFTNFRHTTTVWWVKWNEIVNSELETPETRVEIGCRYDNHQYFQTLMLKENEKMGSPINDQRRPFLGATDFIYNLKRALACIKQSKWMQVHWRNIQTTGCDAWCQRWLTVRVCVCVCVARRDCTQI